MLSIWLNAQLNVWYEFIQQIYFNHTSLIFRWLKVFIDSIQKVKEKKAQGQVKDTQNKQDPKKEKKGQQNDQQTNQKEPFTKKKEKRKERKPFGAQAPKGILQNQATHQNGTRQGSNMTSQQQSAHLGELSVLHIPIILTDDGP